MIMRRRLKSVFDEDNAKVNMTPMLDIIFILLIFFIVTTSFVKEKGFLVERTQASKSSDNSAKNISIHIDENNFVYFNNKVVDIIKIPARIEYFIANNPTDTILFRPHENTNYQKVVDVLDQLKQFKKLKIKIGTYKP